MNEFLVDRARFVAAFEQSEEVQAGIQAVLNRGEGYARAGDVAIIAIDGDCGVTGCRQRALLSQALCTSGPNPRQTSVAALVNVVPPGGEPATAQLVDLSGLG